MFCLLFIFLDVKRKRCDSQNSDRQHSSDDRDDNSWCMHPNSVSTPCDNVRVSSLTQTGRETPTSENVSDSKTTDLDNVRDKVNRNSTPPSTYDHLRDSDLLEESDNHSKSGVELLCRLFPHMKRSFLQGILQECGDNTTRAIEQVLNNHSQVNSLPAALPKHAATTLMPHQSFLHSAYLSAISPSPTTNNDIKSAFSPVSGINTSPLAAIRYPYPPTTRSIPFGLPYGSGVFQQLGYNYNAMAASSVSVAGTNKPPHAGLVFGPFGNPYLRASQDK